MIPFAAVSCLLYLSGTAEPLEISLMDLSALGFAFRLPAEGPNPSPKEVRAVEIRFRPIGGEKRCLLGPGDLKWTVAPEGDAAVYRAETDHALFRDGALDLIKQVNRYTRNWERRGEAAAAAAEGGTEAGKVFPTSAEAFLKDCCAGRTAPKDWGEGMDLWLALEERDSAGNFVKEGVEGPWLAKLRRAGLEAHPLARLPVRGIQAGSAWCPELVPSRDTLLWARDRAEREGLGFGVVLPPVPDSRLEDLTGRVRGLESEITVNDFGTAALLKGEKLTLGVLVNRHRKDPRLKALNVPAEMGENDTGSPGYLRRLERMGFGRLEWETCAFPLRIPAEMKSTVRLPFYQINLSSRCPLRALLEEGDKGCQMPAGDCPVAPCRDLVFVYGSGLKVLGRYNGLFGLDGEALWAKEGLERLRDRGADRMLADL